MHRKILLVEDDTPTRESLSLLLTEEGFQLFGVSDGREALELVRVNRPDLILLDLKMPHMTGAEFRSAQLRDPTLATIPVVVVSGDENIERRAKALGAADFVAKPIDPAELLRVVKLQLGVSLTDKRRTPRKAARLDARWIRRAGNLDVAAVDISAHGLFLATDESTTPGTLLHLELALPGGPIAIYARVVFVGQNEHGSGIGVEFYLMGDDERRAWLSHYWSRIHGHE